MAEGNKTSVWVYIGIGCTVIVALAIVIAAGLGYWGYRTVRQMREDMKDPAVRTEKVKKVLGCRDLPEGYHAAMSLSVPYVFDMAILSDIEPKFTEGGKKDEVFGQRGFIYVKTMRMGSDKDFQDFLEGRRDISEVMKPGQVEIESSKVIGRGSFDVSGATVKYIAHEGTIHVRRQEKKGLLSVMGFQCPGDQKFRMGIWFGPDVAAPEGDATANYTGTPVDPDAIKGFLAHFAPCGA